ncbi:MAG TPA: hypothetical protein VFK02_00505 [Kofleriaceae bacterium]|nr:hypothetical protein [Kofleriaceae bacterium]
MDQGRAFKPAPGKQSGIGAAPAVEPQPGKRTLTEAMGPGPGAARVRSGQAPAAPVRPGATTASLAAPGVEAATTARATKAAAPTLEELFGHRGAPASAEHGGTPAARGGEPDGRPAAPEGPDAERLDRYRARLARPGYSYLRRFAEPVIAQLEQGAVARADQPGAQQRLDDMFEVSHSPDGRGMPEVKQASNEYHAALGAEAVQAMRPGPDRAGFAPEAARVAAAYAPRLEDGVQMTATPSGEGVELRIAPNDWWKYVVPVIVGAAVVGVAVGVVYLIDSLSGDNGKGKKDGQEPKDEHTPKDQPEPEDKNEKDRDAPKDKGERNDRRELKGEHMPGRAEDRRDDRELEKQLQQDRPEGRGYTALDRRGKAELQARDEEDVLDVADQAFLSVVEMAVPGASVKPTAGAEHTFTLRQIDKELTVRLMACPLGDRVVRPIVNPSKDAHVLQISDRASDADIPRGVARGLAEIAELRSQVQGNKFPVDQDLLYRGPQIKGQEALSARDHGAIAELRILCMQYAAARTDEGTRVRRELLTLIDDLGLRIGAPGAELRWKLIGERLAEHRELVEKARMPEQDLETEDRDHLARERDQGKEQRARREDFEAPLHAPPDPKGRFSAKQAEEMAREAELRREDRSAQTLVKLRTAAKECRDGYPRVRDPQIGGGAALAAVRPGQLLVDDRGRWQVDPSKAIAQTAIQLRAMVDAGLGDPLQFVEHPSDRPPLAAIRYFEDSIAAQADVVNGTGTFALEDKVGPVLTIHPTRGGGDVKVQVEGTPLIASGFPRERVPGQREPSTLGAITLLMDALAGLAKDGVDGAEAARKALATVDLSRCEEVARVLEPYEAVRKALTLKGDEDIGDALKVFELHGEWAKLRDQGKERVVQGDEANLHTLEPHVADSWVIAGVGGTSISAAEIILHGNEKAKVTMIGGNPPAGLFTNDQFRQVYGVYGPAGANRFDVITGPRLGIPKHDESEGTFSVGGPLSANAMIDDKTTKDTIKSTDPESWLALAAGEPQLEAVEYVLTKNSKARVKLVAGVIEEHLRTGERFQRLVHVHGPASQDPRLEVASGAGFGALVPGKDSTFETQGAVTARGYVSSIGRGGQASPIIEDLIRQAKFAGHEVKGELLWSEDDEYLGYRVTITSETGKHAFDVTGAASRFLPDGLFGDRDRDLVMARPGNTPMFAKHDAPPEGGNFDGGFAASATQAARYGRHARREHERELAMELKKQNPDGFRVELGSVVESGQVDRVREILAKTLPADRDRVKVIRIDAHKFQATLGGVDLGPITCQHD